MAGSDQRTEKPTEQRLRKARREGRFPVSREAVYAVQFCIFATLVVGGSAVWFTRCGEMVQRLIAAAFIPGLTMSGLGAVLWAALAPLGVPLLAGAALVWLAGLAAQLGITGFGLAGGRLAPDLSRLNPISKLRDLPSQNLTSAMEALVLLPVLGFSLSAVLTSQGPQLMSLPAAPLKLGVQLLGASVADLLWKAAGVFVVFGAWDLLRQRRKHLQSLRMTKQEVRDEHKESEGNPEIKARIRRLRRELLRRRMMAEVPAATAIVVNPTHFAVAIRYSASAMAAPKVVAKGKNWLALRIREVGLRHQVPIVENPPLAQALYKSVEVGQEIPPHLYRAVAEILAYLYRLMNGHLPG
jgi:flagellar biosynthesis protein FlhB